MVVLTVILFIINYGCNSTGNFDANDIAYAIVPENYSTHNIYYDQQNTNFDVSDKKNKDDMVKIKRANIGYFIEIGGKNMCIDHKNYKLKICDVNKQDKWIIHGDQDANSYKILSNNTKLFKENKKNTCLEYQPSKDTKLAVKKCDDKNQNQNFKIIEYNTMQNKNNNLFSPKNCTAVNPEDKNCSPKSMEKRKQKKDCTENMEILDKDTSNTATTSDSEEYGINKKNSKKNLLRILCLKKIEIQENCKLVDGNLCKKLEHLLNHFCDKPIENSVDKRLCMSDQKALTELENIINPFQNLSSCAAQDYKDFKKLYENNYDSDCRIYNDEELEIVNKLMETLRLDSLGLKKIL